MSIFIDSSQKKVSNFWRLSNKNKNKKQTKRMRSPKTRRGPRQDKEMKVE
jgi:hypothetical protein